MRFSLLTIILLTAYAAICSAVFVYVNLWFGTHVVAATAMLLACATIRAFRTPSNFLRSFAVVGWSWIVFWLGFYTQTPAGPYWSFPLRIYDASKVIQHAALDAASGDGIMHSIHITGQMANNTMAPGYHNFLRLVVCASALLVGAVAGLVHELISSLRRQ